MEHVHIPPELLQVYLAQYGIESAKHNHQRTILPGRAAGSMTAEGVLLKRLFHIVTESGLTWPAQTISQGAIVILAALLTWVIVRFIVPREIISGVRQIAAFSHSKWSEWRTRLEWPKRLGQKLGMVQAVCPYDFVRYRPGVDRALLRWHQAVHWAEDCAIKTILGAVAMSLALRLVVGSTGTNTDSELTLGWGELRSRGFDVPAWVVDLGYRCDDGRAGTCSTAVRQPTAGNDVPRERQRSKTHSSNEDGEVCLDIWECVYLCEAASIYPLG